MPDILVLYYSQSGSVRELARHVARGVESVEGMTARVRTVPRVAAVTALAAPAVPEDGAPYATNRDLTECAGLALGSPTRFGNMAAPMKYFLDGTGGEWHAGALAGKPAAVFTSSSTQHGGNESTLLTMMLPLLHHGMLIVGIPFTEHRLNQTRSGGSTYGATHVGGAANEFPVSEDESALAQALGRRLADVASRLARHA
jgi:NAD(P)H dehydrogenase (quinone)